MNTFERIVKILNDMDIGTDMELTTETTFEELDVDSLTVVEVTMACEDEFGITIDSDNSPAPTTLGEFAKMVEAKL